MDFVFKHSKLLNVLEVYGRMAYPGKTDYKALENLTQLRYLRCRGLAFMPSSIGKLTNLQTLDLRYCALLNDIPDVLWKLKRLRHLLFDFLRPSENLRLDTLIHLRTLQGVSSGRWVKNDLVKMIDMERLDIQLSRKAADLIFSSVTTLPRLKSLSLKMYYEQTFPPILEQLSGCVHLQKLHLEGGIEKLPDEHEFPPNLKKLVVNHKIKKLVLNP